MVKRVFIWYTLPVIKKILDLINYFEYLPPLWSCMTVRKGALTMTATRQSSKEQTRRAE